MTMVRHVLVVEDDPNDARLTVRFLSRWRQPLEVHAVESLDDAREFASAAPPLSLILLNHMMPGGSGLDLLQELRANGAWRTVPVVIVTGNSDASLVERARAAGANSCVLKPVDPEEYERTMSVLAEFWLGANLVAVPQTLML